MLPITPNRLALALASLALALLSACGSQDSATPSEAGISTVHTVSNSTAATASSVPTDTDLLKSLAALYPNGQLPANRAAQASKDLSQNPAALKLTAETATPANSQSTTTTAHQHATAQAVAADYQPVQRVQNTTLYGAYFFSIYPSEIATALSGNPNWTLEGPAFWASLANGTDLHPVHRFRNKINGSYLYSIYDSERAAIVANYAATYDYEGVAWYARQTIATGWSALYRFRNKTNGTYLFSAYESEKDAIVANYPTIFALEGIAYYVRQDAPDTIAPVITLLGANPLNVIGGEAYADPGATCTDNKDASCTVVTTGTVNTAVVGSYTITYTATDIAGNISSSTRTVHVAACAAAAINPAEAYSLVFKGCSVANVAEYYAKDECVRQNSTGLIWQGQTAAGTGLRANDQVKTNFDSATEPQKRYGQTFVAPTQAEVDASTNSIGFKNAVNASNLCGSGAWRLPTKDELAGIVKINAAAPMIDTDWFPNSTSKAFWSASPYVGDAGWAASIYFLYGSVSLSYRSSALPVRLVRASQ